MDIKKMDSKIDGVANEAKKTVGKTQEKGGEAARKGTTGLHAVEARAGSVAKAVGDRVEEAAQEMGHGIQEAVTKAAHVAREITQKVGHEVKQVTTKVEHRGVELVDKAAEKLKGH